MCTSKTPKTQKVEEKKVQYLSNPWADGLGIAGTFARGRNSLRNDAPNPYKNPTGTTAPVIPERPDPFKEINRYDGLIGGLHNYQNTIKAAKAAHAWDLKYAGLYEEQAR